MNTYPLAFSFLFYEHVSSQCIYCICQVSGGSEWIMHLIAKKRAKLRIAKRAKKKRKHLRRHHKKTQHMRSYTRQRRYFTISYDNFSVYQTIPRVGYIIFNIYPSYKSFLTTMSLFCEHVL